MHQAADCLHNLGKAKANASLSSADIIPLRAALIHDAKDYYHSASTTLVEAIVGLDKGFFTWPTVNLYYSVYYALRARLALGNECIFYISHTPYKLIVRPGESARKASGTTHKVVLEAFAKSHSADYLLSQPIDGLSPLDWLMKKREESNYHLARFSEPTPPVHLRFISSGGVRKMVNAYLSDEDDLYVFDSDHAILSYPLRVLSDLSRRFSVLDILPQTQAEGAFLAGHCRDNSGQIPSLRRMFAVKHD